MSVSCPRKLEVHAYFDGELDAVRALEIEQHLVGCAACACLQRDLEAMRAAVRPMSEVKASPALVERIGRALDREERRVRWGWDGRFGQWLRRPAVAAALGALAGVALTLAVTLGYLRSSPGARTADELLTDHLRSLESGHLIEVESSDRHTVKPWFAGHADVSPPVADFTAEGFTLLGGRADSVDRRRAAVLAYRHGAHRVNVFTWSAGERPMPRATTLDGYHILCWRSADLESCAVSDAGLEELRRLEQLLLTAAATSSDSAAR